MHWCRDTGMLACWIMSVANDKVAVLGQGDENEDDFGAQTRMPIFCHRYGIEDQK